MPVALVGGGLIVKPATHSVNCREDRARCGRRRQPVGRDRAQAAAGRLRPL